MLTNDSAILVQNSDKVTEIFQQQADLLLALRKPVQELPDVRSILDDHLALPKDILSK